MPTVDHPDRAQSAKMRGVRKTAILLVLLGDQISGQILKELTDEEVDLISREIARLNGIPTQDAEAVLQEFYEMNVAQSYMLAGGIDYARKMLQSAFGPEHGKRMLDRLIKVLGADAASFDALQKADPQQLAKFIHNEHPQTIALVLSHLNPSQAANLLFSLPPDMRADVALRMANLDQISPEIISKIAVIIGQKLKALGEFSREAYGGVRAVAEMFNRLDSGTSKEILDSIDEIDSGLGATIRHLMFVFDDLLLLSPEAMKEVLSKADRKILTVALKGTSDQLKNHFFAAMSQRGSEMMKEDMDALGPIKLSEVESAQQQIIAVVRQLETDGVISLKGAVGEQYVV